LVTFPKQNKLPGGDQELFCQSDTIEYIAGVNCKKAEGKEDQVVIDLKLVKSTIPPLETFNF